MAGELLKPSGCAPDPLRDGRLSPAALARPTFRWTPAGDGWTAVPPVPLDGPSTGVSLVGRLTRETVDALWLLARLPWALPLETRWCCEADERARG